MALQIQNGDAVSGLPHVAIQRQERKGVYPQPAVCGEKRANHPVGVLSGIDAKPMPCIGTEIVLQKAVRVSGTISTQFCGAFQDPLAQGIHHIVEIVGEFRGVEPGRAVMPGAFKHRGAGIEIVCQIADAAGFFIQHTVAMPAHGGDFLREDGVDIHLHALFPLAFTR